MNRGRGGHSGSVRLSGAFDVYTLCYHDAGLRSGRIHQRDSANCQLAAIAWRGSTMIGARQSLRDDMQEKWKKYKKTR
jgi:hypothetical protein